MNAEEIRHELENVVKVAKLAQYLETVAANSKAPSDCREADKMHEHLEKAMERATRNLQELIKVPSQKTQARWNPQVLP